MNPLDALPFDPARRDWLRRALAGSGALALPAAWAQPAAGGGEPPRLALLIGNRSYPDGEDLPPIHKNVRDLHAALLLHGFEVTEALDVDLDQARTLVDSFADKVRSAPPDATVLFYFSGHGAQVDAENLLVSAGLNPRARPETLVRGSLALRGDVVNRLSRNGGGLTIAVIDACRSPLINSPATNDGLNQVEAPPGCLIAFSTGAGKPALAPNDDRINTFYTGSLVKILGSVSDETSFSDMFRLVKYDVQNTMLNHPVQLLRNFAQYPFIAENTSAPRPVTPRALAAARQRERSEQEAALWAKVDQAIWPADVSRLAGEFLTSYPKSPLAGSALVAREGAAEAARLLRRNDVKLFRSAFVTPPGAPPAHLDELKKAGRGDKDAAARLARGYARDTRSFDPARFEGWMQYAAGLGNGIASYDLALHYDKEGRSNLAAQFEACSCSQGYTPPPSRDRPRQ